MPTFASIEVSAANIADSNASTNHISYDLHQFQFIGFILSQRHRNRKPVKDRGNAKD